MSNNTILATAPLTATGYHLKATGTALGQSLIWDNGTNVGIGNTNTSYTLDVSGTGRFTGITSLTSATASTSTTTGGLVVTGGVGIGGALFGTSATFSGALTGIGATFTGAASSILNVRSTSSSSYATTDYFNSSNTQVASFGYGNASVAATAVQNAAYIYTLAGVDFVGYMGGAERMRITSGGSVIVQSVRNNTFASSGNLQIFDNTNNIGWGFQNNTFNNLVVYSYNGVWNTVGYFTNGTGAYVALSDANKKKDFEDSTIGLKEVLQLKPTLYRMKSEDETTDKHLGFIAQEVKNLIPQAYNQNGEDGDDDIFIGLTEMPIIAALTKAIQEMNTKLDEQNQTIQNLQEQINILAK